MRPNIALVPWFEEVPLPGTLPDPAIVVGGTRLLREFISAAASHGGAGRLSMASAFVGEGVAAEICTLGTMDHEQIEVRLVTHHHKDAARAWMEIGHLPWRSLAIHVYPRLHAKIYAHLTPANGGACLVGSHNLSRRGASWNDEAGTLFLARRDQDVLRLIQSCDDRVQRLSEKGRPAIDTMRWPVDSLTTQRRTA